MEKYWDIFIKGYTDYGSYLWKEITNPSLHNYFYWLIAVSLFFFLLEWVTPWRKDQPKFRKDFWLDLFYIFFNFFLFSLIIHNAASNVVVNLFKDGLALIGINNLVAINIQKLPFWAYLLVGFLVRDFIQWWVHRLLHYSDKLWEYHKVHHSVQQMGFAAHLRYHWMENVVYKSLEYLPLALMGIDLGAFFIIHIFTTSVGHFNHSNITVSGKITGGVLGFLISLFVISYSSLSWMFALALVPAFVVLGAFLLGPFMKYLFNSPEMHIWHHSYHLPEERRLGVNFALTLSIWDYIFKTAYIPHDGRDIRLGFPGVEEFPKGFLEQNMHGFGLSPKEKNKKL